MSNEISQLIIEAIQHDNAGNYLEMMAVAQKAVQLYPEVPEAHYILGCGHMKSGAYELAANSFQNSTSIKTDCVKSLNNLGICHFNLGKFQDAVKIFSLVIEKKPDYAKAYYRRAECWLLLGHVDSALAELTLLSGVDQGLAASLQQKFFKLLMS